MRVALGWLREWIAFDELGVSAEVLAEQLTMAGLEVEAVERTGPDLSGKGLIVGRVLSREQHPNADRLSVCTVDLGLDDGAPVEIVCGAPNVAADQKVAVALPGTRLPDGTRIKKSKIRGVKSGGMICSARELGLGDEHEGILVLDPDAPVGGALDATLPVGDTILEIAVMPNRGDTASMIGVAREVRAYFGGDLVLPECDPPEVARPAAEDIAIVIDDAAGCARYVGRVVCGIRVGPSPEWLQQRIVAAGMRPVNNVVDVTNLVMLEFGQPLHAFDLDTLEGRLVRVRDAREGETLRTLDGVERRLEPGDLVIADADRPIAVAGVMGGAKTEVSQTTTSVLLESAWFDPARVRRTRRRLGLTSDASYRFERGVDREGARRAADRAARLLAELAGGEVSAGAVEASGLALQIPDVVALRVTRVNRLLGTDLTAVQVRGYLERLEIICDAHDEDTLRCRIPSHRNDLQLPEDLIEEVARLHGYDEIPQTIQVAPLTGVSLPEAWSLAERVRNALKSEGLMELMNAPFLDPADFDRLRLEPDDPRRATVRILNPVVDRESQMRSTLLPSLLHRVQENRSRQIERVCVFEVARVFQADKRDTPDTHDKHAEPPGEALQVALVVAPGEGLSLWEPRERPPLFYVAKGIALRLIAELGHAAEFRAGGTEPYLHPGASGQIAAGEQVVGVVGELHPEVAARFEIEPPCALVELDLSALAILPTREMSYREVSRHPSVKRDLAVLLERDQPAGEVVEAIRKTGGAQLTRVDIFDRYEGKGIPEGKVSVAFRLVFQRADRTLKDAEVSRATERIVQMLSHRFRGELR